MNPGVIEKASFAIAVLVLFARQRASGTLLVFGIIDLVLGLLFVIAYLQVRDEGKMKDEERIRDEG